jgi:[ribosomal protein S5]-alanine N-acetyltransferase
MPSQPTLDTARLLLRPFVKADAADVQRLAGDRSVADTTLRIPHPYPDGAAEQWIATHAPGFEAAALANFAITLRSCGELVGAIGLVIERSADRAELGYWIGAGSRNRGYCTEAGRAVIDYGFESLALNRIFASHFKRNPASGRVLQKLGMRLEGEQAQHVKKWDRYEDIVLYGVVRSAWEVRL